MVPVFEKRLKVWLRRCNSTVLYIDEYSGAIGQSSQINGNGYQWLYPSEVWWCSAIRAWFTFHVSSAASFKTHWKRQICSRTSKENYQLKISLSFGRNCPQLKNRSYRIRNHIIVPRLLFQNYYYYYYFTFWLHHMACSFLVLNQGPNSHSLNYRVLTLHWTTGEVPCRDLWNSVR